MKLTSAVLVFRLRALIFVIASLLLIGFTSHSINAQFLHPKITSKETAIRTVVVFPAKVNVVRDSMKGPEGMAAESDDLSARVEKVVTEVLAKQKQVTTLSPPTARTPRGGSCCRIHRQIAT